MSSKIYQPTKNIAMKRIVTLFALLMLASAWLQAQRPNGPKPEPKEMAQQIASEISEALQLSFPVQDSIAVAFVSFYSRMAQQQGSKDRSETQAMESDRDAKVKTFLTDEQYKKHVKFMEKKRSERRSSKGKNGERGQGDQRLNGF